MVTKSPFIPITRERIIVEKQRHSNSHPAIKEENIFRLRVPITGRYSKLRPKRMRSHHWNQVSPCQQVYPKYDIHVLFAYYQGKIKSLFF